MWIRRGVDIGFEAGSAVGCGRGLLDEGVVDVVDDDVVVKRSGCSSAGMVSGVGSGSWETKSQYPPGPFPPGTSFRSPSPAERFEAPSVLVDTAPDPAPDPDPGGNDKVDLLGAFLPSTKTAIRPEHDDVVTTPWSWFIESINSRIGASREPLGERSV